MKKPKLNISEKEQKILDIIYESITDGSHHRMWIIDQIVRIITEKNYNEWVKYFEFGVDGEKTFEWDEGIFP